MVNQTQNSFHWSPKIIFTIALIGFFYSIYSIFYRQTTVAPRLMSVSQISRKKDDLMNKFFTVKSKNIKTLGSTSFAVTKKQLFIQSQPVIIINASGKIFNLPDNQDAEVQVTGKIRQLQIPKLEQEFNLRLQDKAYEEYKDATTIVAQHIEKAAVVNDIAENPSKYYNRRLALTGKIENIKNPKIFTLDENNLFGKQDLLVLNPTPKIAIDDKQKVAVSGIMRPFRLAELEKKYQVNLDSELKQELELKYQNKPILIADTVYPSIVLTLD